MKEAKYLELDNEPLLSAGPEEASRAQVDAQLQWDLGTAYDFFVSLLVLHKPDVFGQRPSWAAGVRSRLPAAERKALEESISFLKIPLHWIYTLPEPKDAATALAALQALPPQERLPALFLSPSMEAGAVERLQMIAARRSWSSADLDALQRADHSHEPLRQKSLTTLLAWWIRLEEMGELYLSALQQYHQVFFAEEERQIGPLLAEGLAQAQELSTRLPVPALLEILSKGVRFDKYTGVSQWVLAPSIWSTPFIVFSVARPDWMVMVYGARPADISLVSGETVPDSLLHGLKAMADPTRLRILRYLAAEPQTPAVLSRRLRLRAPTVIHHLDALRRAGLVYLTLEPSGDRLYAARLEAVEDNFKTLSKFLEAGPTD